uniref:Uncharacterized protein n=1 Tax=Biomphalaria glabrata TaxID=6526 RepID=A0A2C9LLJ1_BIOGL
IIVPPVINCRGGFGRARGPGRVSCAGHLAIKVWRSAATQVFFSIGLGFGLISTLASYNKFHNNCYRDALILPVLDCVTSVYAGFVIFAYLGTMAHNLNVDVDKVVDEGPGLVFIAYPSALSTLPLPQLWSVLFFLMLFCVGLDSQHQETCQLSADCAL